ncbi:MAG: RES family NAD+ phosphorylase [Tabrizicola sp.]|uniref:RES family NAD+ phosphorylase n=1 Tax=Tabrizicola sp. TaxID=2005166 RepID=UPI002733D9D3|nr:RES family NAD+ phosphorylase [Tabrizicola sp.]MDP3264088.1 RES family NAD+ phosphorylase [Tabrizicola sp.]MDP3648717.1 RES family NAD+ phosphorylase [Paracoccaceae bacterium]
MSSPIWTRDALRSELRGWRGKAWRLVEAQHRVSTLKLVDSLAEQAILEDILETTKPPVPEPCRGLDYLLSTPFRYRPYPYGSRFRRAGFTPGVWYGAERAETAVAEMVFYRFLFFAEAPDVPFPDGAADYTGFAVPLATGAALDLTAPPLDRDAADWTHPTEYGPCQTLADTAREAGCLLLRAPSVRDPKRGATLVVLACAAFAAKAPTDRQTWRIRVGPSGAQAIREHPAKGIEFGRDAFAADPRLVGMRWDRPRAGS